MAELPRPFVFSQASLQAYVDCPRRFQLRYVLVQPWPTLLTEAPLEAEQLVERAAQFHHLAHQHAIGLDPGLLSLQIHDTVVRAWWHTFLSHPPRDLPTAVRLPEWTLSAAFMEHRLIARLDLVAMEPGERAVVVDWKTNPKPPGRSALAGLLQTHVYRYLLARAAETWELNPLRPEQIEMVYWFAAASGYVERFPYDSTQFDADRVLLAHVIAEIETRTEDVWPLTPAIWHCRCCNYRSLCERNTSPGRPEDLEDELWDTANIDLEQVTEIAF